MRRALLFLILFNLPLMSYGGDQSCVIGKEEKARVIRLEFWEFDQSQTDGWRPFYEAGCYQIAADLLIEYVNMNPALANKHVILNMHAGQMLASTGNYEKAKNYFSMSYSPMKDKAWINWNAFVDATIAFINSDMPGLKSAKEKIELQETITKEAYPNFPEYWWGKKMNLDVVNGFIACFDKPYVEAYENCRG
ncbi:hypothetical protein [Microbulbifer sp. 2205BS26-8]|uniref:hypothetical protein n=1 Tax=Microbulbifer sp. 2205BS26-8 TaxID=3064386 RepID=UPI00273F381B|nr:hypothetical protein [Microbulbifer sp. 2205BS26-8]MDP5208375.1 hypothetical protein [Microbulbifer sp. 2205BS26-8]